MPHSRKQFFIVSILMAVFLILSGAKVRAAETPEPTNINFGYFVDVNEVGTTVKIPCYVFPLNGEESADQTVTWTSSNESIATVDADGNVTGLTVGTVTITATAVNGVSNETKVTFYKGEPTSISLENLKTELLVGDYLEIEPILLPEGTNPQYEWECDGNTAMTYIENATLKEKTASSGIIKGTVTTPNGLSADFYITVYDKTTDFTISSSDLSIDLSDPTKTLTATVEPSTACQRITWTSDNEAVATVEDGKITAHKAGTATIKGTTFDGVEKTCKVTVTGQSVSEETMSISIYRLYLPSTGEHLYTSDKNEYDTLYKKYNWGQEGIAWYAPQSGTEVYRLYHPGLKNHLYTTDKNEVNVLTSQYGWKKDNDGKALYYSGGDVPIYRVYNKGLNGMHHLTTDLNEYNTLPKHGWAQEGQKLNAVKLGEPYPTSRFYNK